MMIHTLEHTHTRTHINHASRHDPTDSQEGSGRRASASDTRMVGNPLPTHRCTIFALNYFINMLLNDTKRWSIGCRTKLWSCARIAPICTSINTFVHASWLGGPPMRCGDNWAASHTHTHTIIDSKLAIGRQIGIMQTRILMKEWKFLDDAHNAHASEFGVETSHRWARKRRRLMPRDIVETVRDFRTKMNHFLANRQQRFFISRNYPIVIRDALHVTLHSLVCSDSDGVNLQTAIV